MPSLPVPITGLYAALLVVLATWLAAEVGRARVRANVSILHGDDMDLATRIRRHGNFTEAVPLALILMAIVELNGAGPLLLHVLGISLVVARICHPLGLHHDNMRSPLRTVGAAGTLLVTLILAGTAAWQFLQA